MYVCLILCTQYRHQSLVITPPYLHTLLYTLSNSSTTYIECMYVCFTRCLILWTQSRHQSLVSTPPYLHTLLYT